MVRPERECASSHGTYGGGYLSSFVAVAPFLSGARPRTGVRERRMNHTGVYGR